MPCSPLVSISLPSMLNCVPAGQVCEPSVKLPRTSCWMPSGSEFCGKGERKDGNSWAGQKQGEVVVDRDRAVDSRPEFQQQLGAFLGIGKMLPSALGCNVSSLSLVPAAPKDNASGSANVLATVDGHLSLVAGGPSTTQVSVCIWGLSNSSINSSAPHCDMPPTAKPTWEDGHSWSCPFF